MTKKYPHIMIDIETLGNTSNAAVVQIGAVGFDPADDSASEPFKINASVHAKSQMDESTVRWWMQQSDEARKAVFSGECSHAAACLMQLNKFIEANAEADYKVWSKPSTFDIVILESLYTHTRMVVPWAHWNTRCLRTLIDVAGLSKDCEVKPKLAHDAASDAEAQALTAIKCFKLITEVS